MALYILHSIFHLARLLYVRPETFGPYYVLLRSYDILALLNFAILTQFVVCFYLRVLFWGCAAGHASIALPKHNMGLLILLTNNFSSDAT